MIGTTVKIRRLGNSKVYKDREQSSFLVTEFLKLKKIFLTWVVNVLNYICISGWYAWYTNIGQSLKDRKHFPICNDSFLSVIIQWACSQIIQDIKKKKTKSNVNLIEKGFLGYCHPILMHLGFLFVLPFGFLRTKNSLDCEWFPVSWFKSFEACEGATCYWGALTPGSACAPSTAHEWIAPSEHSGTGWKAAPPPGAPPQSQQISKKGTTGGEKTGILELTVGPH